LFQQLLPAEFLDQIQKQSGKRRNQGVYSALVVMWLLVVQRLHGGASLEVAVLELLRGLPPGFWPRPCKRIREWRERGPSPSAHTGAYNQARQALPLSVVEQSCDRIFEQLAPQMDQTASGQERVFLLDGSSVRTAHSAALCQLYPPGSTQRAAGHWPLLRVLVAHDLHTGLAMRPEWGPMYGDQAVSEQALLERALLRLPVGSTVLADANFGIFSVAYLGTRNDYPVLVRLTLPRAQRLAGEPLRPGMDRVVVWRPSPADRRSHRQLPADACVRGRLLVCQVQPNNGDGPFLLALFTTLESSREELLNLYGKRWNIETDLRVLKSTLHLDQITSVTPDMVAKEIDMGIAAYNLIRAMTYVASQQSGIPPRGYSFTKVRRILEILGPDLAAAPNPQAAQRVFDLIMRCVQQSTLPRRRRKRPAYPRAVWRRGATFPDRHT